MTILASFFYSAHLPERLAPGRFDYIGECAGALLPGVLQPGEGLPCPRHQCVQGEGKQGQGEKQIRPGCMQPADSRRGWGRMESR